MAQALRTPLMPWQRLVAEVASEHDPVSGLPAYREVIVTVPRQSGKTHQLLVWELHRALMWGKPQRIAYTAQTGLDASQKLIDDQVPIIEKSLLAPTIAQVYRALGSQKVVFTNGSLLEVFGSNLAAGHGKTVNLGILDEYMAKTDHRTEQAMLPAMATVADAQQLVFSTAGTQESVPLKRKVEAGRASVTDGATSGIAYFEWSADEHDDPDDEEVWARCMPALGHTISLDTVRHARQTMPDGEFRRAFLNQWTVAEERVIPAKFWARCVNPKASPSGQLVFSVDAEPIRLGWASIVAADQAGRIELIDRDEGIGWIMDRLLKLVNRHSAPVVIDQGGPLGNLIQPLETAGVEVIKYGVREFGYACGDLYDRIIDGKVEFREHPAFDAAAAAARKRKLGDAWAWARHDSTDDISPLVAATLAAHAAQDREIEVGVMLI